MRVVVVSAWEPWRSGHGGVWVLHHHLRELSARHEITVLAAGAPAREATPPAGSDTVPGIPVRWFGTGLPPAVDYAGRRIRSLVTGEPAHVFFAERPALRRALAAELAHPTDLVYGFGWGTARLHRFTGKVPVVHTAVDAWGLGHTGRLLPAWRRLSDAGEQAAVRRHERRHYPLLAAVTVVAEPDADYLREHAPGARVEVVTNGVEAGPPPVPTPPSPVLGFHGNFISAHNVDAAATLVRDIYPLVRRELPQARVILAGRSPTPAVRALQGDGVELIADAPELRAVLDRMAVGVSYMTSGTGLKNKVLEMMASGRPVVANPAALAGIGEGDGVICAEGPEAAAAAVVELCRDPDRVQSAGRAARARVERDFTWARSAGDLEAVWTSVATAR